MYIFTREQLVSSTEIIGRKQRQVDHGTTMRDRQIHFNINFLLVPTQLRSRFTHFNDWNYLHS
jgi:hypothetical protein